MPLKLASGLSFLICSPHSFMLVLYNCYLSAGVTFTEVLDFDVRNIFSDRSSLLLLLLFFCLAPNICFKAHDYVELEI